jgi:hypothetical protein
MTCHYNGELKHKFGRTPNATKASINPCKLNAQTYLTQVVIKEKTKDNWWDAPGLTLLTNNVSTHATWHL